MKQGLESLNKAPFQGKSAKEIIEHFSAYKFVDDHGHQLEKCEEFHGLVQMALIKSN